MSYLRPTCSDAAVRAINLSISKYMPVFRQGDARSDESTTESLVHGNGDAQSPQRLPSRRPLDRRWDESRGLVFERKKTALRDYTWTPNRGVVFAGGMGHRRAYAMRPTRVPAPQQPQESDSSSPSSSATGQAYGSSLPSLERPSDPSSPAAIKVAKQFEFEAKIEDLMEQIKDLELKQKASEEEIARLDYLAATDSRTSTARIKGLESNIKSIQDESHKAIKAIKEQSEKAKESEYLRGKSELRELAQQEAEQAVIDELQRSRDEHKAMVQRVTAAEAQFPELKERLEAETKTQLAEARTKMEKELAEAQAEMEKKSAEAQAEVVKELGRGQAELNSRYAEMNRYARQAATRQQQQTTMQGKVEEKLRELQREEAKVAERKKGRVNYTTYRSQFNLVHDERKVLDEYLKDVQFGLAREMQRVLKERSQRKITNELLQAVEHETTDTQDQDNNWEGLEQDMARIRKDLANADTQMKALGHWSRQATLNARFQDTTLAAETETSMLRDVLVIPAMRVRADAQREIDDCTEQIKQARNATLRQELLEYREAIRAQVGVLNTYVNLMHKVKNLEYYETLKLEPYARKAVCMGLLDLNAEMDDLRRNEIYDSYEIESGFAVRQFKPGHIADISTWRDLRETIERLETPIKKRAQLLELTGQHHADEQELDQKIDERIADLREGLRSRRAQMFASHREARSAARRATSMRAQLAPEPKSASTRVPKPVESASAGRAEHDRVRPVSKSKSAVQEAQKPIEHPLVHVSLAEFSHASDAENALKTLIEQTNESLYPVAHAHYMRQRLEGKLKVHSYQACRYREKLQNPSTSAPQSRIAPLKAQLSRELNLAKVVQARLAEMSRSNPQMQHVPRAHSPSKATNTTQSELQERLVSLKRQLAESKDRQDAEIAAALELRIQGTQRDIASSLLESMLRRKASLGDENPGLLRDLDLEIARQQDAAVQQSQTIAMLENILKRKKSEAKRSRKIARLEATIAKRQKATEEPTLDTSNSLSSQGATVSQGQDGLQSDTEAMGVATTTTETPIEPTGDPLSDLNWCLSEDNSKPEAKDANSNPDANSRPKPSSTGSGLFFTSTEPKKAAYDFFAGSSFHEGRTLKTSSVLKHKEPVDMIEPLAPIPPETNESVSTAYQGALAANEGNLIPHTDELNMSASHDKPQNDGVFTEAASSSLSEDDAAAKNQAAQDPSASETSSLPSTHTDTSEPVEPTKTMAQPVEEIRIEYEIPSGDMRRALTSSPTSKASFWRYSLYKNAAGEAPTRHYCTTYEQTEAQLAKFLDEKVVGFDLEWDVGTKPGVSPPKRCVSLIQIAAQDKVALFHIALFRGRDSANDLLPPSLRAFLENPNIMKTGVNVGGDVTRMKTCFGVEMQGCVELSHWYRQVTFGETNPKLANKVLVSLGKQVQEILYLPLAKGEVRTSTWSRRLNSEQIEYAISDAYAGLRLYYELEKKRKAMASKPPRPAFWELRSEIPLGEGITRPSKTRQAKPAPVAQNEPADGPEPAQELDDGEASEDESEPENERFFDAAEDLEDPYLDSQDASEPPLPEITYPTLPPLEDFSPSEDENSSLPSDPLSRPPPSNPPRSTTLPTPEALAADTWARSWQSRLPTGYVLQVTQPQLRAYHVWHHQGFSLDETAALLRREPLASSTVVTYVAEALQKENLEFEAGRAKDVLDRLPMASRSRFLKLFGKVERLGKLEK